MTDSEWLSLSPELRLNVTEYIFSKLTSPIGYSFAGLLTHALYLIDHPGAYRRLYDVGGMEITNALCAWETRDETKENP